LISEALWSGFVSGGITLTVAIGGGLLAYGGIRQTVKGLGEEVIRNRVDIEKNRDESVANLRTLEKEVKDTVLRLEEKQSNMRDILVEVKTTVNLIAQGRVVPVVSSTGEKT
jgi:hypothetical protein